MIVVTGAAGRLGRQVVNLLLKRGYDVVGTDRVPADEPSSKFVEGDLNRPEMVDGLLDGAEAVIHMGAIPGPLRATGREIFENNLLSTFNVMTAAAEKGPRRVVFSSSAFRHGVGPRWGRLCAPLPTTRRRAPHDALRALRTV